MSPKPASLSSLTEFAPVKGQAAPSPEAAIPETPVQIGKPAGQGRGVARAGDFIDIVSGDHEPPGRVQVGLRLSPERKYQLRRIALERQVTSQHIIEQVLCRWMDNHDRDRGKGG